MSEPDAIGPELARVREEYDRGALNEEDLDPDPLCQLDRWLGDAVHAGVPDSTAMALATATRDGVPSVRMLLLKGLDRRGLVFFTNYGSAKARDLAENPRAALVFHWAALQRQARVVGTVEIVSREASAAYFACRPLESQVGALVSPQSQVIPSRAWLEEHVAQRKRELGERPVPLPDDWGGYRLSPTGYEFWQGRPGRQHDRLRYQYVGESWVVERLAP